MARRLQTYSVPEIQVTFDPARCIHAAECVRGLPEVFDTGRARWIRPERAPAANVAAVVARCPTGALHYRLTDGDPETIQGVTVRMTRNGPLYVLGSVRLETDDGAVIAEDTRVALCRCGKSANQPFCDGTHRALRFADGSSGSPSGPSREVGQSPT